MKVLLVNNFYYNRGGDCTYMFALKRLLEAKGHNVIVFSMHHPQNFDSEFSQYFVSYINYEEEMKNMNISSGIQVLNRTIYSREAKKKIEQLIEKENPDIAHLQNIHHHITPSIFYALKRHGIPIIWTLHDYTVICPNTSFLSHGDICEKCKKRKYFWPPLVMCKKNSLSASTVAAIETTIHRMIKLNNLVDTFISPSEFLRKKLIEYGFKEEKVVLLNHFIDLNANNQEKSEEDYYLYVGRISEEKGIKTLIDAAVKVHESNVKGPTCIRNKLKIVGKGPLFKKMLSYTSIIDKNRMVEFLGHKHHTEVIKLIKKSRFIVVPSEWYENFPFAVLEAFTCGKPVIGSKIGGIPELVRDTERGMVFEVGDSDDLSSAIRYLLNNPDIIEEMGRNAKTFVENELNSEKHYEKLIYLYNKLLR
jgi:glycosyltransferase involved in cell wall biosynthesis